MTSSDPATQATPATGFIVRPDPDCPTSLVVQREGDKAPSLYVYEAADPAGTWAYIANPSNPIGDNWGFADTTTALEAAHDAAAVYGVDDLAAALAALLPPSQHPACDPTDAGSGSVAAEGHGA